MNLSLQDLQAKAASTGFPLETLDKVIRLINLLNAFQSHPFLKDRMALKGGTALNLFVFDLPRLSVDIDLNYVGLADREVMLAEKEKVEQAITAICGREAYTLRRVPKAHAGGKWRLGCRIGRSASISSLCLVTNADTARLIIQAAEKFSIDASWLSAA